MNKIERYRQILTPLLAKAAENRALADVLASSPIEDSRWNLLVQWAGISAEESGTDDPRSFLPFCALPGPGAVYGKAPKARQQEILSMLRRLANVRRWRIREAAAMALQRIGEDDALELERILTAWLEHATFLEQRAAVAALAHPPLLGNADFVRKC